MTADNIAYRKMDDEDADQVFGLVRSGFDEFVRTDVTDEGRDEFFRSVRKIIYDRPAGHFIITAESADRIIGMTDIRDNGHICLFFVSRKFHRRGIGRCLLEQAISECISNNPEVTAVDVNSSLFAVQVYKKLGFIQTESEQIVNGIRFVPMVKSIKQPGC